MSVSAIKHSMLTKSLYIGLFFSSTPLLLIGNRTYVEHMVRTFTTWMSTKVSRPYLQLQQQQNRSYTPLEHLRVLNNTPNSIALKPLPLFVHNRK